MAEIAVFAVASYVLGRALSKPEIKIWLPGLPPLEFDNPLFRTREGQRMGSLEIQETAEGAPENRCFGPQNRVAGALVWMSDLKEVKQSESGGGKGGGGGEFITYQYFTHAMIRLARARTPISRIPRVWADGKLLFDLDTDVSYSSNGIDAKLDSAVVWLGVATVRNYLRLESDVNVGGRPDLSKVKSGNSVTVSGYGGTTISTFQLLNSPTVGGTSGQLTIKSTSGSSIGLLADDVLEFEGYDVSYSVTSNVTVTTGGTTVSVQNTIEADRPIGSAGTPVNVVAKRGAAANNGTFTVVSSSIDPDPVGTKISIAKLTDQKNRFRKFTAVAVGGATVVIFQRQPAFKATQVGRVDALLGGPDQAVPAILQQVEGLDVTQVYAMRNRAGFVLQDLCLTDFGNRLPNFEGLVEVTADPGQVADAIRTVLTDDADWPESGIDVSGVSGEFEGFAIRGPQSPNRSLTALQLAFDVVRWEQAGKLCFANRSSIPVTTIPASEIGAYDGEQAKRSLIVRDPPRDLLPSEVNVTYRSPENDLQTATKRARRTEEVPVNIRTVDLGMLVIDDDRAQQIADRLLAVAWGAQRSLTLPLPPSRAGTVRNGMILSFGPVYGQNWKMFVDRVDRGANLMVMASGPEYDPVLLEQAGTSEGTLGLSASGNTQDGGKHTQAPADLSLLDVPALSDQHRTEPGLYIAARSSDPSRPWRGAVLYWSIDAGVSWNRVVDVPNEAVCGKLVTAPTVTVLPGLWDRANTIRITISHTQAQLGSVSEDACLAGSNRFLIGREIIGAARVVFVERDSITGEKTYDLSTLQRGQRDTDQSMGEHVAGEEVIWLDGPGLQFLPLSYSHVDNSRLWKLVPHGGFIEDAEPVRMSPTARNCRPFHVRDAVGVRDGSNNLTLTWERMSRAARVAFEHGEPLDEEVEAYEIDVVVAGVVKRTISATGSRTVAYSAADQTADGVTLGGPVTLRFYQLSAGLLRGQESEYSI